MFSRSAARDESLNDQDYRPALVGRFLTQVRKGVNHVGFGIVERMACAKTG